MKSSSVATLVAVFLLATALSCGGPGADALGTAGSFAPSQPIAAPRVPTPRDRIVGRWEAEDGSGVLLEFRPEGQFQLSTQGHAFMEPGDYTFVDDRTIEVRGKSYVITYNTEPRPIPQSFHFAFENDGRNLVLSPTKTRPLQMQFTVAGNYKLHVFPPDKGPVRYRRKS
jgi:hypothetical protein